MPKYVAANSPYVHHIDFMAGGELVAPSSATVTIKDNTGAIVGDFDAKTITLAEGQTSANILIPALDNVASLEYEVRYIQVVYTVNDLIYTSTKFYVLRDNVFFPLTADEVLASIGMMSGEFPEDQIDILSAYYSVQVDVGTEIDLNDILTGGTELLPILIEAVKLKAASLILVGAQNSMMQMEQADNTLYRRFMEVDFDGMGGKLSGRYGVLLSMLLGTTLGTGITFSATFQGADAVTGEE